MLNMLFKRVLIGLALVLMPSATYAQCSGQPLSGLVCGNPSASTTLPIWGTQTSLLDRAFGTTQGTIINRGASVWAETSTPSLGKNGGTGGSLTLNGSTSGSAVIGVKAAAGAVIFNFPITNGSSAFILQTDGAGNTSWVSNASGGTVQSVALSLPSSVFTISGSPVTTTGTLTGSLATQTANLIWAGPTTGSAATPTFRSLVGADLPNPSASTLGGIQSTVGASHEWVSTISTSGVPGLTQPAFTDISGSITSAQCIAPTLSAIGCVEAINAVTSNWIRSISTAGIPALSQPSFTDLTGAATLVQLPSIGNNSVLANNSGGTASPQALTASNILDMINNVQGDILYRNASGWVVLAPGTNGQVFTTSGAAANPAWTTVTGTGTVTSITSSTGIVLSPTTITTTGSVGLASITNLDILANISGGSAAPIPNTLTAIIDAAIGSTQGDILYRGASTWQVLAPGTNGQVLTQGASTPAWGSAGSVSSVTIAASTGLTSSGTCTITTSGTCTLLFASITADNLLANSTGSSAAPIATAIGSCSGATNALTYSTSSHAFGCNSFSSSSGTLVSVVTYLSSQTITIPSGATKANIKYLWGGSGGSAGGSNGTSGGGGGAGALSKYLSGLTAGNTIVFTQGSAGSAGSSTTNGGNGTASTLASGTQTITTLTANGGAGGTNIGTGGAGGTASNGDVNITGQIGSVNITGGTSNLGGGASGFGLSFGGASIIAAGSGNAGAAGGCVIEWFT